MQHRVLVPSGWSARLSPFFRASAMRPFTELKKFISGRGPRFLPLTFSPRSAERNGGNSRTSCDSLHLPTTNFHRCSGSLELFHIAEDSRQGLTPWSVSNRAPKKKSRFGQ